jgi:hypothetical protein
MFTQPLAQLDSRNVPLATSIVARSKSDPSLVAAAIREAVRAIDKDQPVDKVTTMSSVVSASIVGAGWLRLIDQRGLIVNVSI